MECSVHSEIVEKTFKDVSRESFAEKRSPLMNEEFINSFLDEILSLKEMLAEKTQRIQTVVAKIAAITWFDDLNENELMLVNDIISATRDLHASLIRQYSKLSPIRSKGIAKKEIKAFKSAIDDLKEIAHDLEFRFFTMPNDPEYTEILKKLSSI